MKRWSLEGYTDKCIRMLNDMVNPRYVSADKQIPATLIRHCEGIAFITILKAGMFVLGANAGGGCVIAKVKDPSSPRGWRWSGPVSVTVGGLGGGFIFGGEKIDSIIILNTKSAVRAFMGKGQITLGGNVSLAVGPVGRDIEAHAGLSNTKQIVAAYSYSKAQGLYIGGTLEGAFVISRPKDNIKYYGDPNATAERILSGEMRPPLKVDTLHRELYAIQDRKGDYSKLPSSKSQNLSQHVSSSQGSESSMNLGPSSSELPPEWREVFTPDGKPYYHNVKTNETSWERPAPPASSQANPYQYQAGGNMGASSAQSSNNFQTSNPFQNSTYGGYDVPSAEPVNPSQHNNNTPQAIPTMGSSRPFQQTSARPMPPMPARPAQPRNDTALAMYDYTAARPDELSFKANDRLTVLDKSDANWWKCSVAGKSGLAPSNYLKAD